MPSLLYRLIFASRASSNHHRFALQALTLLEGENAALWRDLFLRHHETYLEGAKAPDDVFRDYKNHVLHVREGEWGGAIEAAEAWRARAVQYFAARRWRDGIYACGVMSHYVVDPFQPFHTHQTEDEGPLHRAVEQSFSKAWPALAAHVESALGGWPRIPAPAGPEGVADLIREGARAATIHYETIIDHYDLAAGAKSPAAGLDDALIEAIAGLVAKAAASLAAALSHVTQAAAVAPQASPTGLDIAFATLRAPVRLVAKRIDDLLERQLVLAQYEEYLRTGKVLATMSEDDRTVRAQHAAEVLRIDPDALNAQTPRKSGTAHGAPLAPPSAAPTAESAAPALAPAPAPPIGVLSPDAPVEDAPAIGPRTADRLEAIGVRTVAQLLALAPDDVAAGLDARHIRANTVADWQAMASLALALPQLRSIDARLLLELDVRDPLALADEDPDALHMTLLRTFAALPADEARGAKPPEPDRVAGWIAAALAGRAARLAADVATNEDGDRAAA